MARKVERLSRNVPVSREILVGTVAKVDHGVTDRGHELLGSARAWLDANLHVFITSSANIVRSLTQCISS